MRNKRRTDEEWLSLIQQCRSSGFSDRVWCEQNDISINTFYNTVTRLRKKSCMIPETDRLIVDTSEAGAGASAVMYSIVETAKANNLNIFQYLYMVLLYMTDYMNSSAGIEQLMPWSDFIKEQCSGIIDVESTVPENRIPLPCRLQGKSKVNGSRLLFWVGGVLFIAYDETGNAGSSTGRGAGTSDPLRSKG